MELLATFMGQSVLAQAGEIVLFANAITMAMPTRWKSNMVMDIVLKILNFLSMNIFKNRNMDDK
jgi:uncharacterized membrane protein|tara:strand:+ start:767 stop:958 length:192 start_codon:yes stop_codon:yes gene_type:complete